MHSLSAFRRTLRRLPGGGLAACAFAAAALHASPLAAATSGAGQRPSIAQPAPVSELSLRLATLEQQGRARPAVAAAKLVELIAGLDAADTARRIDALQILGVLYAAVPDAAATERVAASLDAMAQPRASVSAALVRARWLYKQGSAGRAGRLLGDAMERYAGELSPPERLRCLELLGRIRERENKLDEAVRLQQEAVRLADAIGPTWRRADLRGDLAYTLHLAEQGERARAISVEAITMADLSGDDVSRAGAWTTEAIVHTDSKDDAAVLHAWQAALQFAQRSGSARDEALGFVNLVDYYLTRGDYATALDAAQSSLPLARKSGDPSIEAIAVSNLGLALISVKRKAEGMARVREGLALHERNGALLHMLMLYEEFGSYLEKAGYEADALEAFHQHRRLADEWSLRDQQQTIVELQEGFDHDRRQRDLALLERENRLKEAQLTNRELQQRLWLAGAGAGVLALGMGVMLYRRVRATNAQLASTNEQLVVLAERDPLTGLANRRHFQKAMRQRDGHAGLAGTLFLIDIDHFKRINDRYGHGAGDKVLVETARRLRATARDDDLVVRWGGEEFLVLVRSTGADSVEALADRLLAALAGTPIESDGQRIRVSGSIGYATFPLEPAREPVGWERAIELVDAAMYMAKAHGRNRAYGVGRMPPQAAAALEQTSQRLERAWRDGEIEMTLKQGPVLAGEPA